MNELLHDIIIFPVSPVFLLLLLKWVKFYRDTFTSFLVKLWLGFTNRA